MLYGVLCVSFTIGPSTVLYHHNNTVLYVYNIKHIITFYNIIIMSSISNHVDDMLIQNVTRNCSVRAGRIPFCKESDMTYS